MRIPRMMVGLAAMLLVSCGGGGGGGSGEPGPGTGGGGPAATGSPAPTSVFVSESYQAEFSLFQQALVVPVFPGLEGKALVCRLTAGTLPAGVQLRSDCALFGRPTAAGDPFSIRIRVNVPDLGQTFEVPGAVFVRAPALTYPDRTAFGQNLMRGTEVNDLPLLSGWTPGDESLAWDYRLTGGALPPGLSLDASTGAIRGTVTTAGSYHAIIQPRASGAFGTFDARPSPYDVNVDVPSLRYFGAQGSTGLRALLGNPDGRFAPSTDDSRVQLSGFRLAPGSSLPEGMVLDPQTGLIFGTPTKPSPPHEITIEANAIRFGASTATIAVINLEVVEPIVYAYRTGLVGSVGTPLLEGLVGTRIDDFFRGQPDVTATQRTGACTLPQGVSMIGGGVMMGTPTAAGTFDCTVDVEATLNGAVWRQTARFLITIQ